MTKFQKLSYKVLTSVLQINKIKITNGECGYEKCWFNSCWKH